MPSPHDDRPPPESFLAGARGEEQAGAGRLKIFLGASPGVGKTFAMIEEARVRQRAGRDVVVALVETHGRAETAALLDTLEQLPRRQVDYRGQVLSELDVDALLARRPAIALIDELAHTNAPGSRHPKRWQDVEELCSAGIDVYTTLNVQHLESLNDVVGQITGIRVAETVPDKVFDLADEVTLVDLPPEELLQRLQDGKVYMPQQADRARKHFFRKGNLIALREMALRRTADRVDAQMREYRSDQSIQPVWQAHERILVGLGPGPEAEQLVRTAARLAISMKAEWLAAYVETPALQTLGHAQRQAIVDNLRLAQTLGATTTATLSGDAVSHVLLDYARSRNVSRLVVGKPRRSLFMRLLVPSVTDQLAKEASDIDLHVVVRQPPQRHKPAPQHSLQLAANAHLTGLKKRGYLWALAISATTSVIAGMLLQYFELSNVIMLYLLGVMLISIRYGRGPGILASILSVSAFDFFFVPPKLSFTVSDTQYLLTFGIMLSVALVISNLTSSLRYQAVIANYRERRSLALYEIGKELASTMTTRHIVDVSVHHIASLFQSRAAILLPDADDKLQLPEADHSHGHTLIDIDLGIAQWTYDHQEHAGLGTNTLPSSPVLYVPLKAPMRTRGVLAIVPENQAAVFLPEQRQLLDTFAAQIALALERKHYVEVARDALISMESEHLTRSAHAADFSARHGRPVAPCW